MMQFMYNNLFERVVIGQYKFIYSTRRTLHLTPYAQYAIWRSKRLSMRFEGVPLQRTFGPIVPTGFRRVPMKLPNFCAS